METTNILITIWLKLALNDSSTKSYKVYKHFGDLKKLYEANEEQYAEIPELKENEIAGLLSKDLHEASSVLYTCQSNNIDIITIEDKRYPQSLLEIENPPCILFAYGNYDVALSKPCIAIVGTRDCTEYGYRITSSFSGALALSGCTIVTGVAKGIDEAAYKSAVKANGSVIMVLPDGMLISKNKLEIVKSSLQNSVIITEHIPHRKQTQYAYHERNRIISGLAKCCLVTQAPEKSGALITAGYALEQGKELFVTPANIDIHQSNGSNRLFYDGAIPALGYKDILDIMKIPYNEDILHIYSKNISYFEKPNNSVDKDDIEAFKKIFYPNISSDAAKVLTIFGKEPLSLDYIMNNCNMPINTILAVLSSLETVGAIISLPGSIYKINLNTEGSQNA